MFVLTREEKMQTGEVDFVLSERYLRVYLSTISAVAFLRRIDWI